MEVWREHETSRIQAPDNFCMRPKLCVAEVVRGIRDCIFFCRGFSAGHSRHLFREEVAAQEYSDALVYFRCGWLMCIEEYGIFVDIGLGRTDALMPNSMLGDVALA